MKRYIVALTIFVIQLSLLVSTSHAQDRTKIVVGVHLDSNLKNQESFVASVLQLRLNTLPDEISEEGDDLIDHLDSHLASPDSQIDNNVPAMKTKYETDSNVLLVLTGIFLVNDQKTISTIYLGDAISGFSVKRSQASILVTDNHAIEDKYLNLILLYSMLKEAKRRNLDFRTYISPLRSKAVELLNDLKNSGSLTNAAVRKVTRIDGELAALAP